MRGSNVWNKLERSMFWLSVVSTLLDKCSDAVQLLNAKYCRVYYIHLSYLIYCIHFMLMEFPAI